MIYNEKTDKFDVNFESESKNLIDSTNINIENDNNTRYNFNDMNITNKGIHGLISVCHLIFEIPINIISIIIFNKKHLVCDDMSILITLSYMNLLLITIQFIAAFYGKTGLIAICNLFTSLVYCGQSYQTYICSFIVIITIFVTCIQRICVIIASLYGICCS